MESLVKYYNNSVYKAACLTMPYLLEEYPFEKVSKYDENTLNDYYDMLLTRSCNVIASHVQYLLTDHRRCKSKEKYFYPTVNVDTIEDLLGFLCSDRVLVRLTYEYSDRPVGHSFIIFRNNRHYYWLESSHGTLPLTINRYKNDRSLQGTIKNVFRNIENLKITVIESAINEENIKCRFEALSKQFEAFIENCGLNYRKFYTTIGKELEKKRSFLQPTIEVIDVTW